MKRLRLQFRTFESILRWIDRHLTTTGKVIGAALLLALPLLANLDSPAYMLFWALVSLATVSGIVGLAYRPRLAVQLVAPDAGVRGETVELLVRLTNRASTCAYDLGVTLADPPASWQTRGSAVTVSALGARDSRRVILSIRPQQRGLFPLPVVRVMSAFPLNLFRFETIHPVSGDLVVLPGYQPLMDFELADWSPDLAGRDWQGDDRLGQGGDYFGSREYVPGMPVRRWDTNSSARLGQPIVREFCDAQPPTVGLVLDPLLTAVDAETKGVDRDGPLEAIISRAAALSEALTRRGYPIVLLSVPDRLHVIADRGLTRQHEAICRALAVIDCATERMAGRWPAESIPSGVRPERILFLSDRADGPLPPWCEDLQRQGSQVVRVRVAEG